MSGPDDDIRIEGRRSEDLRGSTPVLSARDVLIELRDDVRVMNKMVDILASQNLNARLTMLERAQSCQLGLAAGVAAAAGVATGLATFLVSSGVLRAT